MLSKKETDFLDKIQKKINYDTNSICTYSETIIKYFKQYFGCNDMFCDRNETTELTSFYVDKKVVFVWNWSNEYNHSYRDLFTFITNFERHYKLKLI